MKNFLTVTCCCLINIYRLCKPSIRLYFSIQCISRAKILPAHIAMAELWTFSNLYSCLYSPQPAIHQIRSHAGSDRIMSKEFDATRQSGGGFPVLICWVGSLIPSLPVGKASRERRVFVFLGQFTLSKSRSRPVLATSSSIFHSKALQQSSPQSRNTLPTSHSFINSQTNRCSEIPIMADTDPHLLSLPLTQLPIPAIRLR